MKKIILTALTVLMIFGLVGCSGVLHNTPAPVQEAVKIDGASWYSYDITVWGNNDPSDEKPSNIIINDNGKGKQTVDTKLPAFEASKGGVVYYTLDATKPLKDGKFELNVAYQDDNPVYTAKPGVLRVYVYTNLENPTIYIWDDADCPFEKSSAWPGSPITLAGATVGTPFYLDGYFLKGSFLDAEWNSDVKYLFDNPEEDPYGNLVYTVDFKAAKADAYFAIVKNSDNSRWHGNTSVDQDYVEFEYTTDGMKSSQMSGFESGKDYRIYIKTTPDEKVFAKVVSLYEVTVSGATVKATNLPEELNGKTLYFTGTFNDWLDPGKAGSIEETVTAGEISVTLPDLKKIFEGSEPKEFDVECKFASTGWARPEIAGSDGGNAKFTLTQDKTEVIATYEETTEHKDGGDVYRCKWEVK